MMKRVLTWIGLGIGIGILLSVAAAYAFGPRGASTHMNLYDGATWTDHNWLWHNWRTEDPVAEHTKWARSHMTTKRTYWPVFVCSGQRRWFGGTYVADGFARDMVREIYTAPLTQERKIELLHEYHQGIEVVLAVDRQPPYRTFYDQWDSKLKESP